MSFADLLRGNHWFRKSLRVYFLFDLAMGFQTSVLHPR